MLTFYLVRHAETDANVAGIISSYSDPPINETGKSQSEELGEELKDVVFAKVFTSDRQRTVQTANGILSKSSVRKPEFTSIPLLREKDFGTWEGRPNKDVFEYIIKNKINPKEWVPPEGESFVDFMGRIDTFFNNLCELADANNGEDQNILIVCHGLFMQCFFTEYLNKRNKEILLKGCTLEDTKKNAENTVKSIFQIWKKEEGSLRKVNFLKVLDISHLSVSGHTFNYAKKMEEHSG